MNYKKALILIVHGSRVTSTADEMNSLVEKIAQNMSDTCVIGAYMEIQSPCLEEAVEVARSQGVKEIDVLPLFVLKGRHIKDDIPSQVLDCQQKFTDCTIKSKPYIGSSEFFIKAITDSVRAF